MGNQCTRARFFLKPLVVARTKACVRTFLLLKKNLALVYWFPFDR